jgi:recombinational DNA repair protein RecR
MPLVSAQCPVLHSQISRLADLEGHITRVFCPEYLENGECRIKRGTEGGGPLSQLLERIDEGTLDRHGRRCDLC